MASGAPARAPSLPLSRAGVSLRLTVSPSESSSESGSDLPSNLQCDLPCAQVVRLHVLRQAVRSVHGHGAAPFTRLPSLVKDPEHPNVLYWSITDGSGSAAG